MKRKSTKHEAGTVAIEFLVSLLLWGTLLALFFGLGHVRLPRQQAVVGAYLTARYQTLKGRGLAAPVVSQAVSGGRETWRINLQTKTSPEDYFSLLGLPSAGSLGQATREGVVVATVSTTPRQGLLPSLVFPAQIEVQCQMLQGTWTCAQVPASLLPLPGLNQIGLSSSLSCCKTWRE